jgi:hypothetical protein
MDCVFPGDSIRIRLHGEYTYETYPETDGYYVFSDLEPGDYVIEAGRQFVATYTETLSIDRDYALDISLRCLLPVPNINASGSIVDRPFNPIDFKNRISWTTPSTDLEIISFKVYRSNTSFTDPSFATEIAFTTDLLYDDYDIESGVNYYYAVVVEYVLSPGFSPISACVNAVSVSNPDPSLILIIDYDDGATPVSGMGAEHALSLLLDHPSMRDYSGNYTITSQNPESFEGYQLDDYDIIFVELGINDASTHSCHQKWLQN